MKFTATSTFAANRNLDLLIRSLVVPPVGRAVRKSVDLVLAEAQRLVPVDTGELRASGRTSVQEEGHAIVGTVAFTAAHAGYVEYGTGQRGASSPDRGPYPYSASWPGMLPQPYLRPAVDNMRQLILAEFRALLK